MADPLNTYPFPSNIHILSSVTLKLNDSNYLLWKTQFESLLSSQKLVGFVNGSVTVPEKTISVVHGEVTVQESNPLYEEWFCTDQLVRSWLFGTLSEEVLGSVHTVQTSRDVWLSLAENYNKSSLSREYALRRSLQLITKKDKELSVYHREFKTICDSLSAIGKPVEESMKIFGFLNGLSREYDPIATVIQSSLSKYPPPTFHDVVSEVKGFDMKLKSYEENTSSNPHMAYNIQTPSSGQGFRQNAPTYNPAQRGRGRSGGGYRGRGGFNSRGRGFSQHQNNNTYGERPTCQICGRSGHTALKCYNRFDNNYQPTEAFSSMRLTDDSCKEWYPDSGATDHITSSTDHLQTAHPYEGNETVMVGDGAYMPITHVGATTIASQTGNITLNDVLVCPSVKKSLMSVSKLCDDYPCGVYFDAKYVYVIDLLKQQVVTKGSRSKGLYTLKDSQVEVHFSNRHTTASEAVWHSRLAHSNPRILQQLRSNKDININKNRTSSICEPCQMGKSSSLQFFNSESFVSGPLERVHCDLWGPSPVLSNQGFRFYAIFVDEYTRFSWLFPLKQKSEFFAVFVAFQKLIENKLSVKIKQFQSDGGGEFVNLQMKKHLLECGIEHRISCPYTPQQNGLAERKHRHIIELSLSMMFQSHMPLQYWVDVFFSACFVGNMLPAVGSDKKSPFEKLYGEKPDYASLRVVGSACYPCLRPLMSHKLEPRSLQCVFIGYSSQYKGYRCLHPPTGKVYITRHAVFDEECFPFREGYKEFVPKYKTTILEAWQRATRSAPEESTTQITRVFPLPTTETPNQAQNVQEEEQEAQPEVITQEQVGVPEEHVPNTHPMQTRGKAGIHKPNNRYALLAPKYNTKEPRNIAEAMQHPGWNDAVSDEITKVHILHTWDLVPAPEGINILTSRWVFTVKLKPDGTVECLKARLVARGNEQEEGLDYLETFSPVVRTATIRLVLQVAITKGWSLKQLDVSSAFLHGELQEPVYMFQPPGFVDPQKPNHVCRLTKALYGLKQAPMAWFDTFSNFLIDFGFTCSKSDPSLFTYHHQNQTLVLLLYVDDILLTGSCETLIQKLLDALNKRFSMKDLGTPKYFLGIEIESKSDGMFLHQQAYTKDILYQSSMLECNPMPTPLPQRIEIINTEPFPEPTYFRSIAGKLQYLTITRPDIQYAVNFVCQRMHLPTMSDFAMLKRILRYLKGTMHLGLHIVRGSNLILSAYCDSDWAGCKETRRSTTGFCTLLGPNLISWSAKRQATVSRSSTEAEYRALTAAAQEVTWISYLLRDLGVSQSEPTRLHCDNLSAVYLSTNPALHSRTKHFDTDYHYIREQVALGLIETQHIPSKLQIADIFTKPLSRQLFFELRNKLGVQVSPYTSLRGNVRQHYMGLEVKSTMDKGREGPSMKQVMHSESQNRGSTAPPCTIKRKENKTRPTTKLQNRYDTLLSLCDD